MNIVSRWLRLVSGWVRLVIRLCLLWLGWVKVSVGVVSRVRVVSSLGSFIGGFLLL